MPAFLGFLNRNSAAVLLLMGSYKDLHVWNIAIELCVRIYSITEQFPKNEKFGLVDQLRRCSVSVPSNIAEGNGRSSKRDILHFLFVARGSLYELSTQLIVAVKLGYLEKEEAEQAHHSIDTCGKLLNGMINYYRGSLKA